MTYSGGSPAPDTIAAGSAATVYDGSASAFDASSDVWVVLTVPGSGALAVTKEADLAAVVGDWAGLARVVQHTVEPYQPQAYLASGQLGAPAATVTVTILSSTAARALSLWNGSANDAPPATWDTGAFDDSAWGAAVVATQGPGHYGPPGSTLIWPETVPLSGTAGALLRQHFTLPAGTITAATFTLACDDICTAIALNGHAQSIPASNLVGGASVSVPASDLLAGGANVLALAGANSAPSAAWAAYALAVTYASASGGTEGALLYFHDGAWAPLGIGASAQELTVVSGDPAWTDQPASYTLPTASATTLGGIKVGSGLSISAGVLAATSSGSVTSVALAGPTGTTVSGSPVTGSGTLTLTWASQSANAVLAAPDGSSGAPTFRVLAPGDIPGLAASKITSGQLAPARGGTGVDGSAATNGQVLIGNGSGYTLATLTAGSGVTITNAAGTITIASSGGGSGTVTSVALSVPGFLSVAGSPITTSGTLAVSLATQSAGTVFAGPASGSAAAPTFRALQGSDLPAAAAAGGHIHAHGHFL